MAEVVRLNAPDVIPRLRDLLARAERGEVTSVAYVVIAGEDDLITAFATEDLNRLLGAITYL